MSEMWTSKKGILTAKRASLSATLVCVYPAGLNIILLVLDLYASWIASISSCSALLWKKFSSHSDSSAIFLSFNSISSSDSDP